MSELFRHTDPIILDSRTVKLKLTSRHIVHDMERFAGYGQYMTMFDPQPAKPSGQTTPEDFPEEMNDALAEILDRENSVIGYPTEEELEEYCSEEEDEDDGDLPEMQSFSEKLELFLRLLDEDAGDEDDSFVFETMGKLEKVLLEDGRQVIEVSYTEDESMEGTNTVIRFDPQKEGSVSIYHTGGVISALVCEEGVRHITVYQTPIAPFEIALYTKKCRGGFTYSMGGVMELDYMVELRGADLQRTILIIEADPV